MNTKAQEASNLIKALGGTVQVARICSVSAPSVSQWRKRGIPKPWMLLFRERYPERFDADGRVVTYGAEVGEAEAGKAVELAPS